MFQHLNEALDDDERIDMHTKWQKMLSILLNLTYKRNEERKNYRKIQTNIENDEPKDLSVLINKIQANKNEIKRLQGILANLEGN